MTPMLDALNAEAELRQELNDAQYVVTLTARAALNALARMRDLSPPDLGLAIDHMRRAVEAAERKREEWQRSIDVIQASPLVRART